MHVDIFYAFRESPIVNLPTEYFVETPLSQYQVPRAVSCSKPRLFIFNVDLRSDATTCKATNDRPVSTFVKRSTINRCTLRVPISVVEIAVVAVDAFSDDITALP